MINGERVKQARELRSLTQDQLAKLVGVSQAAIAQIEGGFYLASDALIEAIALHTHLPLSFFTQESAPSFSPGSLLFRAHASTTRRQATEACRHAQLLNEIALFLQSRFESMPVRIPRLSEEPVAAARLVRKGLGLDTEQCVPHLLNMLEWHGARVLMIPDLKGRDAFSFWMGDTPVMAVVSGRPGDRQRLTAAHELGHLVMHANKNSLEVTDKEADRFAAEFLMPEAAMRREIQTPVSLSSLASLKSRWKVSIQALIRRAHDLQIITDRQYRYLFENLSARGWRTKEPIEMPSEKPRGLRQMAEMLYGHPIDYETLAHDVHLMPESVKEILERYAPRSSGRIEAKHSPGRRGKVVELPRDSSGKSPCRRPFTQKEG
jgi:Zn-dependent peptidase ImmA (M78 family)/DNA-binding XRE family transcriptional regulator